MTKSFTKNTKKETQIVNTPKNAQDAPLSLDQSLHEVQSTDLEKTSF